MKKRKQEGRENKRKESGNEHNRNIINKNNKNTSNTEELPSFPVCLFVCFFFLSSLFLSLCNPSLADKSSHGQRVGIRQFLSFPIVSRFFFKEA